MNICFLCNEYPPAMYGGIGIFVRSYAHELQQHGAKIIVTGVYRNLAKITTEYDNGVEILRLPYLNMPKGSGLLNRLWLSGWLTALYFQKRFDLLEVQDYQGWSWAVPGFIPSVMRLHGSNSSAHAGKVSRAEFFFESQSYRRSRTVIAPTRFIGETTNRVFRVPHKKYTVIPHGIRLEELGEVREVSDTILFFGTLSALKGLPQLIEAWPAVVREHPTARLVIAGKDLARPPLLAQLLGTLTAEVRNTIQYLGNLPHHQMMYTIRRAAVVCLPTLFESQSLAALEAMSLGKAVIFSGLGVGPEVIKHGVDGLLLNPHKPQDLAAAMVRLLTNPAERHRMGLQARETVRRRFSMDTIIEKNLEVYARLLKNR